MFRPCIGRCHKNIPTQLKSDVWSHTKTMFRAMRPSPKSKQSTNLQKFAPKFYVAHSKTFHN